MQPLLGLEFVQYGIKRSRADAVPVTGKFLDHFQAEYRRFRGMMQDMQSDEAGIQGLIFISTKLLALVSQEVAQPSSRFAAGRSCPTGSEILSYSNNDIELR